MRTFEGCVSDRLQRFLANAQRGEQPLGFRCIALEHFCRLRSSGCGIIPQICFGWLIEVGAFGVACVEDCERLGLLRNDDHHDPFCQRRMRTVRGYAQPYYQRECRTAA
jgi:hypothetical protein